MQNALFEHSERRDLGQGAWIDLRSGWVDDAATLFDELMANAGWRAERRQMYERVVNVPRLVSFHDLTTDPPPAAGINRLRRRLNDIYAGELGEPFTTIGLCLYRDGTDSVAWHGDTIGRGRTEDTMVAIVSLGATRVLALRPKARGPEGGAPGGLGGGGSIASGRALRLPQHHGDLLVMGGSCQRTWEHAVPKTAVPKGPRISIQFRPRGVR